jgi:hypothetical protein
MTMSAPCMGEGGGYYWPLSKLDVRGDLRVMSASMLASRVVAMTHAPGQSVPRRCRADPGGTLHQNGKDGVERGLALEGPGRD